MSNSLYAFVEPAHRVTVGGRGVPRNVSGQIWILGCLLGSRGGGMGVCLIVFLAAFYIMLWALGG